MTGDRLIRQLGMGGAVVVGLGSILGTGVFVSLPIAVGFAGRWAIVGAAAAALVAIFNGLSSARLATTYPVAGGTYEYGYRLLGPWMGFLAGWLFVVAKSASAAAAALGLAEYGLALGGFSKGPETLLALGAVAIVTILVISGIRRTTAVNTALVAITLLSLGVFMVTGLNRETVPVTELSEPSWWEATATASAFLFVAYTGYGRIATLGEEVRRPERVIPPAVVVTLLATGLLYTAVAFTTWRLDDGEPRQSLAALLDGDISRVVGAGAVVAMLGVLVNLILGLSRVWLAMARRADAPRALARISPKGSPTPAVIMAGVVAAGLTLIGDVRTTWSFSAMMVLFYYAITNLAALRLPRREGRRSIRWTAWPGLISCLILSFWVPPTVWVIGAVVIMVGIGWRIVARFLMRNKG